MGTLDALVAKVLAFFGPVAGSLYAHLNKQEFERALMTGVLSGGGTYGVLSALWGALPQLFNDPADAALVKLILAFGSAGVALYAEVVRRLGHGDGPALKLRFGHGDGPALKLRFAGD